MEQARITSHQGTPAAQAARGKPAVQGKDSLADTQGGAATGGFMALLASLGDDGLQDTLAPQTMADPAPPTDAATADVAAQSTLSGGGIAWLWQATIAEGVALTHAGSGVTELEVTGEHGLTEQRFARPLAAVGVLADVVARRFSSDTPLHGDRSLMSASLQDVTVMGAEQRMVAATPEVVAAVVPPETVIKDTAAQSAWLWQAMIAEGIAPGHAGSGVTELEVTGEHGLTEQRFARPLADMGVLADVVARRFSSDTPLRGDRSLMTASLQDVTVMGAAQNQSVPGMAGQGGGGTGQTMPGLMGPGRFGQRLSEPGLTAVQVAGPAIGLGALADAAANLTPSDGPLPEGSLLLQTALQDAAVGGDGRGAAVEMQGAAGKRKVLGRLAAGVAPASDAGSAAGAQSTGQAGTKGQGVSLAQGASFQPLVVERRDASDQAREGSRHMEAGIDGAPAVLAQWASDTAAGVRGVARGGDSGASVSGAGGAVEPSQERPVGLAGEVGTEFVDPAMAGTEDAVAEQVAYWVHQNIQNAKLTVKHDGQPVEVSVSLTGNEAHVSFGSDEAQTRDLIDGSVAQLRDMLRQEGLVLSGVTVSESGSRQGDEGAGSQKNPQRHTGVVVPAAVATPAAGRVNVLGDRAVDIFV